MKNLFTCFQAVLTLLLFVSLTQCRTISQPEEYYCVVMAGEPTQTSVVLLARLQRSDTLVNNDIQGIKGFVKFRIMRDAASASVMESRFFAADSINDFIAKFQFTGLRPGQNYLYSISYGKDTSNCTSSSWNHFKTLNLPESDKHISFVLSSSLNFNSLLFGEQTLNISEIPASKLNREFPALSMISFLKPDFMITQETSEVPEIPGDNFNDNINAPWHRLLSIREFKVLTSGTPFYYLSPSYEDYSSSTVKHLPVPEDSKNIQLFRSYRLNRDVQIWILKSLFPSSQNSAVSDSQTELNWLKINLKESDAPFKLIISPSGIINPDNSLVAGGITETDFATRRDSLFFWLKNNGYKNNGLYFLSCNSRHHYHAIDASGFEEFSCGPLAPSNSKPEVFSADSLKVVSEGVIKQPYLQNEPIGGFLIVTSDRDEYDSPVLLFRFFDENKKLLYAINKF